MPDQDESRRVENPCKAVCAALEVGYPVLISPAGVLLPQREEVLATTALEVWDVTAQMLRRSPLLQVDVRTAPQAPR